ncbi:MAG: YicC/YloC family endoribonuclease [Bacteroidia bacterium]
MLRSMTGYGSAESATDKYLFKVELKSLNGKFMELNLRLPKLFSDKEIILRNHLGLKFVRGSVNVFINVEKQKGTEPEPISINKPLAIEFYNSWKELADNLGADSKDIFRSLMMMPELVKIDEIGYEDLDWEQLLATFEKAFANLDTFRKEEGKALQALLTNHCLALEELIPEVEEFELERLEITKLRLQKNLNELMGKEGFDKNRFEQELVYYLEKLDITEEKNRLISHCRHFLDTLKEEQSGRKLNFIAQEIGREINTMGSKASHAGMQKAVVKMKEELEKIKEQVLNVL